MSWTEELAEQIMTRKLNAEDLHSILRLVELRTLHEAEKRLAKCVRVHPDPPRNTTDYQWGLYDARATMLAALRNRPDEAK